jgi:eukaryotic-like serine/threonine-protein kinase
MTPDDGVVARALDLFDRYADMPEAELPPALDALRARDPDLCAALTSLLRADAREDTLVSPLEWMASRDAGDAVEMRDDAGSIWRSGTRLGAWCVDDVIETGGMGVVYAAHRADGLYERGIAIKTIRPGLMSPAVLQAFGRERNHLARLEHPGIVALLDAGIAADGQPWLAMQRVHGEHIDRWCDAHRADLRARATLMIEACSAFQHAHAHGVLHQDIKASNLLVTQQGAVRVLDFGLSALLSPKEDASPARIGISASYAAPEVFRGAPPSIAIDIYALGVLLYRLLCDAWPSKPPSLIGLSPIEIDAPRAPSALALACAPEAARMRGVRDPQALSRALHGDLDAIALRCVRNDPAERYGDVAALCADLQAWLDGVPVSARGGGLRYRATRYATRHALALVVSLACVAAATAGAVTVVQQQRHARQESANVEMLSQLFERSLGAATLSSLGNAPLNSRALLDDTERRLRTQSGDGRAALLARGLTALARAHLTGGDYDSAERLSAEAKALGSDDALQAARTDAVIAQLSNLRARHTDAERVVRAALAAMPSRPGVDAELVGLDLRMQLARARWGRGDTKGALAILDAAVASAAALEDDGATALAELLGQRGYALTQLFRLTEAEADLDRALAVLGDRSPTIQNTLRRYLAGALLLSGRKQEAHLQASASLDSNLRIFGPSHPETGRAWVAVGKTSFYLEKDAPSQEALDKGTRILETQIGTHHPDLADAFVIRSALAFERGDIAGAQARARKALDILERAYGAQHEASLKRRTDLAFLLLQQAEGADMARKDALYAEAGDLLLDAIRTGQRQGLPMGYARDEYASILLHFGKVAEAEAQARMAISEMSALFGAGSDYVTPGHMSLMRVHTARGRYDDAEAIAVRLLAVESQDKSPYTHFLVLKARLENAIARGDPKGIRNAYREAERVAKKRGYMDALKTVRIPGTTSTTARG